MVVGADPLSASGTEEIAGEEYWRFTIAPPSGDGTMRALDELFGITEVPMTVLADKDGIVRIIRVEMTYQRVRDTSATTTIEATLTFEPNEDVPSIEPPPGSDVEDLARTEIVLQGQSSGPAQVRAWKRRSSRSHRLTGSLSGEVSPRTFVIWYGSSRSL